MRPERFAGYVGMKKCENCINCKIILGSFSKRDYNKPKWVYVTMGQEGVFICVFLMRFQPREQDGKRNGR